MTGRAPLGGLVRGIAWPRGASVPVGTPLQPSVVYAAAGPDALDRIYEGGESGYSYAREGHPNADVVAEKIARLEGVEGGLCVGSGMAAVTAATMGVLRAGDHVLGATQLYGRSLRLLDQDLPRLGVETSRADASDADTFAAAMRPNTRMILVEAVSNPMLRVADLAAIRKIADRHDALIAFDNTFTTPACLRGSDIGADIVIHSVTKLLAGHSDVTLGWVAAHDPEVQTAIRDFATTTGLTASPFDCWLAERGLQSFELRFARAQENAAALADALAGQGAVARVLYPGRADHPDHARAAALLGANFGTMVTFDLTGGRAAVERLVAAAPQFPFAPTLGDVATTLSHPASSSHRALTAAARAALGITEGTVRVSLGIERPEEVVNGFAAALHGL